jgi:hypothetical protein
VPESKTFDVTGDIGKIVEKYILYEVETELQRIPKNKKYINLIKIFVLTTSIILSKFLE